jgi:putative flippase GtrA
MINLDDPVQRAALLQLGRYGVIGLAITLLGQAIYLGLADHAGVSPMVAIAVAWIVGVAVGYFAHGWISFRGHGERDDHAQTGARFVGVNLAGYAMNSFWVWLLVEMMAGPTWWPVVPNIVLTPLITYFLHRHWTFR